jgi:hypothetical protein
LFKGVSGKWERLFILLQEEIDQIFSLIPPMILHCLNWHFFAVKETDS